MKKFDMKRFGLVARWTFRMDRKELLTSACVMVFVYLFMAFMFFWPVIKGEFHATSITISNVVSLQFSAYLIYVVIGGAYVFNNMTAKTGRLAFMMLPATAAEKFAVRFIYGTVAWAVMGFAALCVADVLRILTCLAAGVDYAGSAVPGFVSMVLTGHDATRATLISPDRSAAAHLAAVAVIVWAHSLYMLGGAFFRRYRFVLSSVTLLLVIVLHMNVSRALCGSYKITMSAQQTDLSFYVAAAVFTAVAVIDWMLSYKLFSRMQVINNKWTNL